MDRAVTLDELQIAAGAREVKLLSFLIFRLFVFHLTTAYPKGKRSCVGRVT